MELTRFTQATRKDRYAHDEQRVNKASPPLLPTESPKTSRDGLEAQEAPSSYQSTITSPASVRPAAPSGKPLMGEHMASRTSSFNGLASMPAALDAATLDAQMSMSAPRMAFLRQPLEETQRYIPEHYYGSFSGFAANNRWITETQAEGQPWDLRTVRFHDRLTGASVTLKCASATEVVAGEVRILTVESAARTVKVWDNMLTCQHTLVHDLDEPINAADPICHLKAAIADDVIVTVLDCFNPSVKVWNAMSGQCEFTFRVNNRTISDADVAVTADAICVSISGFIHVWDRTSQAFRRTINAGANMRRFAVADGIVVTDEGKVLRAWDPQSGQCLHQLTHPGPVNDFVVKQGVVVSAAGNEATIWDLTSGEARLTLAGHFNPINSLALENDIAVTGSSPDVKIWDLTSGRCLNTLDMGSYIDLPGPYGANFLSIANGSLAAGGGSSLKVWRAHSSKL